MRPSGRTVVAAAAVVVGIAATCSLGLWQVRRGEAKETLLRQVEAAARATPVAPTAEALRDPASLVQRHLRFEGRWRADHVVYLDNRPLDGRVGLYVLMALAIDGARPTEVMVDRGWVARDANDRARIAPYETSDGRVTIEGVALDNEPRLLDLGTPAERRLGGIWQNFDYDAYARASGSTPLRLVVRQDAGAPADGLTRDWPDRGDALQAQIDRHHGYAFQWFGLAAALAAFLVYRIVRVIRHGRLARN